MCLAVPGKIENIIGDEPLSRKGKVNFGGILKEVSLAYVPEAKVGDYVIVHAGFALHKIEEADAMESLRILKEAAAFAEKQEREE